MAANGYVLDEQAAHVETRIKGLINDSLKEICKAYVLPVSGTKAVLQSRCIGVLRRMVQSNDHAGFEELRYRINNRGQSPARGYSNSPLTSYPTPPSYPNSTSYGPSYSTPGPGGAAYRHPNMPPNRSAAQPRAPANGRYSFKSSPFHEIIDTLSPLQDLQEMPQNRHTVKATFSIPTHHAAQMRQDSSMRVFVYCGMAQAMTHYSNADVAFPHQIDVKVNDTEVKANFKGLKNKPGSTKPTDITSFVRKLSEQQNSISVTYALTNKRFSFAVYLVRYVNAEQLIERIKRGHVIPKQRVLDDMSRANADPDIAATSVRMSLKDPISTMRIALPVRASHCTHNQCFDGAMFLQLQEQAPQWLCPVCTKSVPFESLCIDKYFEDILARTSRATEKVDIEPSGHWHVITEEESQPHGRAAYDDDFDDPVEVKAPVPQHGMLAPSPTPAVSVTPVPSSAQRTPQGTKRPVGAVIDLTLSDEEEEPVRPAVRPRMV